MKGFELSKIVERHGDSSKEVYPHVTILRDFRELIHDDDIDLVIICTPNALHYSMIKASLEAGKHVVVEKPFVPTSVEADELIQLSEDSACQIFVYQNRRWDGDFLTIQKLLDQQVLGDLLEYESHFDRYRPELPANAWRDEDKPGGGIVYDLGSHLIDQALVLFGIPDAVFADIKAQRKESPVDDYFSIQLSYPSHTAILKAGMMVMEPGPRFILHGREGSYVKYGLDTQEAALKNGLIPGTADWGRENEDQWGILHYTREDGADRIKLETRAGSYQRFYENVYDVLVNDTDMIVTPQQARDVIRIIELSFESNAAREIRQIRKD